MCPHINILHYPLCHVFTYRICCNTFGRGEGIPGELEKIIYVYTDAHVHTYTYSDLYPNFYKSIHIIERTSSASVDLPQVESEGGTNVERERQAYIRGNKSRTVEDILCCPV